METKIIAKLDSVGVFGDFIKLNVVDWGNGVSSGEYCVIKRKDFDNLESENAALKAQIENVKHNDKIKTKIIAEQERQISYLESKINLCGRKDM